ncbi:MAG: adenylyltransferase/cytidyltransferase family protein [Candidatus Nealsonbacteria bacterium]|nr:adenylyltransferase/cytidyltransferase family protein [Candidatus Nealsonbacteria bacterium]
MPRNKNKKTVVAVSGGFDPIHIGHIRLFNEAKKLGDELMVILNNDNWLMEKKGFLLMSEKERKEIIESLSSVDRVIISKHRKGFKDRSVCAELASLKPDIFANGGDRDKTDAQKKSSSLSPEQALCQKLGIKMVFNVGRGGKIQSSSWLAKKFPKSIKKIFEI